MDKQSGDTIEMCLQELTHITQIISKNISGEGCYLTGHDVVDIIHNIGNIEEMLKGLNNDG